MKRSLEVDFEELLAERMQRIRLTVVVAGGDAAGQAAEGGGQASAEGSPKLNLFGFSFIMRIGNKFNADCR